MKSTGIRLSYSFGAAQSGAALDNPLFEILGALQAQGSIKDAAAALGLSYRHVWGTLRRWEEAFGQPLVVWARGTRAQLTPYALRLMWAERQARTRMTPHLEALRAELGHVLRQAADGAVEVIDLIASHDLALPHLQALAATEQVHVSTTFAGSSEALRALLDGRCRLAGFHAPRLPEGSRVFAKALRPLLHPGRHKLIGSHSRWQGLMYRKERPEPPTLQAIADGAVRFANRQPGSGTRLLLEHLLQAASLDAASAPGFDDVVEHTHVAVAAAVASGAADVGLGIEAAAREFGLAFVPLALEDYFFVCLKATLDTPAVQRLRALLAAPAWQEAVGALPGYQPQRPGKVLSLTRVLPWWDLGPRRARARPLAEAD